MTGSAEKADYIADMERMKAQCGNPILQLLSMYTEIVPMDLLVTLLSGVLLCKREGLPANRCRGSDAQGLENKVGFKKAISRHKLRETACGRTFLVDHGDLCIN